MDPLNSSTCNPRFSFTDKEKKKARPFVARNLTRESVDQESVDIVLNPNGSPVANNLVFATARS